MAINKEIDQYLQINPLIEKNMWRNRVLNECAWRSIDRPTPTEWKLLESDWEHGRTPQQSLEVLHDWRRS